MGSVVVYWLPSSGELVGVVTPGAKANSGFGMPSSTLSPPVLSGVAPWLAANPQKAVTVPAQSGGGRWRALGFPTSYIDAQGNTISGTVIVAEDVTSVYGTIQQLAGVDLIVSIVIVFVLLIVGDRGSPGESAAAGRYRGNGRRDRGRAPEPARARA